MSQTLLLYAHLLVFLIGTLLYGFLVRELLRNQTVLPGLPIRLLVGCLTIWYGGCLVDELATILRPLAGGPAPIAAAFDILRAMAWLASFPLLAHTVWRLLPEEKSSPEDDHPALLRPGRPSWFWLLPGYLTLLAFLPAAWRIWLLRSPQLESAARGIFPLVLLHAALSVAVTGWLLLRVLRTTDDARLRQFVRWLLPALLVMLGLLSLGPVLGLKPEAPKIALSVWRLSSEGSGLVLGLTFLYFVQRYNLLRLSLSHRSLRHFVAAMALVLLVMLYGPAEGIHDTQTFRRLVAFGLVGAVVAAMLMTPLRRAAVTRSQMLRRLLGDSPTPRQLDEFSSRLQSLELPENELLDLVADQIGRWLVTHAQFFGPPAPNQVLTVDEMRQDLDAQTLPKNAGVPAGPSSIFGRVLSARDGACRRQLALDLGLGDGDRERALLWRHFQNPATIAFNRLEPPSSRLASVLGRTHLHAVFPLRVGGAVEKLLGIEVSATGGGYQDGEMEAVRLVLRQLGSVVGLRRLVEARISQERLMAEQERLSMLGMVSASLVHEVKNPLSSMKVLAETVGEELEAADPGSEQAEDLALIVAQIDRLNSVAHEILGFARAPHQPVSDSGIDLGQLMNDTLAVCRYHAKTLAVEIDETGIEPIGRVAGTAAGWQTIALNLINNAVEHAPAGSTVKARLFPDGESAVFETENKGSAIAAEIEDRLFENFVSVGGTGLGLGLVARRVGELGGTIAVDNVKDRIVFRVCSPVIQPNPASTEREEEP